MSDEFVLDLSGYPLHESPTPPPQPEPGTFEPDGDEEPDVEEEGGEAPPPSPATPTPTPGPPPATTDEEWLAERMAERRKNNKARLDSRWRARYRAGDFRGVGDLGRTVRLRRFLGAQQAAPRKMLIPGLWPWGTIPALGGNFKAGKSTLIADLARALVNAPDDRFLGHFDGWGSDVDPDDQAARDEFEADWSRGRVIINAETPAEDFEAALDLDVEGWDYLTVEHLEEEGGAQLMDLTDPDLYDLWAYRLTGCGEDGGDCSGGDDYPPAVVIVDGVTAILQAAGKSPEDFGLWYSAFRRLLREIDVPNGLATGHNTMKGSHLMGGTAASAGPDGLWTYSLDNPDNPNSARRFSVMPRMGGIRVPPLRVILDERGRPVVASKEPPGSSHSSSSATSAAMGGGAKDEDDLIRDVAALMVEQVRAEPGIDGAMLTEKVEAGGRREVSLAGRAKAVELGLIRKEKCVPGCEVCGRAGRRHHHRREHYWPTHSEPAP